MDNNNPPTTPTGTPQGTPQIPDLPQVPTVSATPPAPVDTQPINTGPIAPSPVVSPQSNLALPVASSATTPQFGTMPAGSVIAPTGSVAQESTASSGGPSSTPITALPGAINSAIPATPTAGASGPLSYSSQMKTTTGLKNKFRFKMIAISAVALLFISGGAIFGLYVPNTPNNVWNTGLNRSGTALETLAVKATDKKTQDLIASTQMEALIKGKLSGSNVDGSFDVRFDKSQVDGALTAKLSGSGNESLDVGVKFFVETLENKRYPNFYLQYKGVNELAGALLGPELASYEGKWILLDSDYLSSVIPEDLSTKDVNKTETPTSADIAALSKVISEVNSKYMFTTNSEKAVLKQKSFVGKEKIDGINTYHYTVSLDKTHATNYCVEMVDKVAQTEVIKKLSGKTDNKETIDLAKKSCKDDITKDLKESDSFDMWIDSKYKIIHKIRITDEKDKNSYIDIGQNYKGGDDISLFITSHDDQQKTDTTFNVTSNIKTNITSGEILYKSKKPGNDDNLSIKLSAAPFNGEIKKPDVNNTIPIKDILKAFGVDPELLGPTGDIQSKSNDTERQIDIKTLHGQLEAYFAQNGYYPGLADINNSAFIAKNMKGLDAEALKDPESTTGKLVSTPPTKNAYSFVTTPADCKSAAKNCTAYSLSAVQDGGAPYVKNSLN